jgi:hypothetical protein
MNLTRVGILTSKLVPRFLLKWNAIPLNDTVEILLKDSRSLIRWGDGETGLLLLRSLTFQKLSFKLWWEMFMVFTHGIFSNKYHFAIPHAAFQDRSLMAKFDLWPQWYPTRLLFASFAVFGPLVMRKKYLEAHAFRGHEGFGLDWTIQSPLELLSRRKRVLYVGNLASQKELSRWVETSDWTFLTCSPEGAFKEFKSILGTATAHLEVRGTTDTLVVVSAGPMGKALARRLSKSVTVYDLGHWHEFLG